MLNWLLYYLDGHRRARKLRAKCRGQRGTIKAQRREVWLLREALEAERREHTKEIERLMYQETRDARTHRNKLRAEADVAARIEALQNENDQLAEALLHARMGKTS